MAISGFDQETGSAIGSVTILLCVRSCAQSSPLDRRIRRDAEQGQRGSYSFELPSLRLSWVPRTTRAFTIDPLRDGPTTAEGGDDDQRPPLGIDGGVSPIACLARSGPPPRCR